MIFLWEGLRLCLLQDTGSRAFEVSGLGGVGFGLALLAGGVGVGGGGGQSRCDSMMVEAEGIALDYCRQKVTQD